MITLDQLKRLFPSTPASKLALYVDPLNKVTVKYGIVTKARLAMFIAQVGHESGSLTATIENLNYNADGLRRVFPKYFDASSATSYARNPQRIANRVYANRMGNGDEKSGDGWNYRGRGLIQITGKNNYVACAADLKMDLPTLLNYLETPEGCVMSAGWFWNKHSLNNYADKGDIVGCTKVINGGTNGLEDRSSHYNLAIKIM